MINWEFKFDGSDIEFILGKECDKDGTLNVWCIDFGMVNSFENNESGGESIANALEAVEYFPLGNRCAYDLDSCSEKDIQEEQKMAICFWSEYRKFTPSQEIFESIFAEIFSDFYGENIVNARNYILSGIQYIE